MRRVLKLPSFISMEYKKHEDSLNDKFSYRNPSVVWRAPATTGRQQGQQGTYSTAQYIEACIVLLFNYDLFISVLLTLFYLFFFIYLSPPNVIFFINLSLSFFIYTYFLFPLYLFISCFPYYFQSSHCHFSDAFSIKIY